LFGRVEYGLKRSGHLARNVKHAQADWADYAAALGPNFFDEVVASGIADTLISNPPRKLMRDGLQWSRGKSTPLQNVHELFVEGVCRVRNSVVHGEKLVGGAGGQWSRDTRLIREALAVLKLALSHQAP
jgi:hypothetical protein